MTDPTPRKFETVYRCQYDGLDPAGCQWSTTRYSEIDAHEEQIEPGHLVVGRVEQVDD